MVGPPSDEPHCASRCNETLDIGVLESSFALKPSGLRRFYAASRTCGENPFGFLPSRAVISLHPRKPARASIHSQFLQVMSKTMASVLIAYGIGLGFLGLVVQKAAPTLERVTLIAGLVGGGLCLVWGLAALVGLKGRAWATLSAIATAFVLLSRAIHVWSAASNDPTGSLAVRWVVTFMLVLTVGIVMYLLHGERPPEFYLRGVSPRHPPAPGRNDAPSRVGRSSR